MSGWKSTKDGKHFRTRNNPGINSSSPDSAYSKNYGTQPSSISNPNNRGYKVPPSRHGVGGEATKKFRKARESAEKYLERAITAEKKFAENSVNGYSGFAERDLSLLRRLVGYPQQASEIRDLSSVVKAKILKAELEETYPNTKFSTSTTRNSIDVEYVSGQYPYGATEIGERYSDAGKTDSQSDYYDTDTYVNIINNGGMLSKSKEHRLASEIQDKNQLSLNAPDFNESRIIARQVLGHEPKHGVNNLNYDELVSGTNVNDIINDKHKEKYNHKRH